ncbi:hypothetical protein QQ045_019120 [Rhodiola kirilowii]
MDVSALGWKNRNKLWHEHEGWSINQAATIGVDIVARDHLGCVLWIWADGMNHCSSSSEAEGQAFCLSLELAQRLNVKKAVFEVDSLEVYKAISFGAGVDVWCYSWLRTALDFLRQNSEWVVQFLRG